MGRHLPLLPPDGPLTPFASALRSLRDSAPASAASVESLVIDHKVAASTVYAALNGKRLPSRKTLAKIVSAWGGVEVDWMKLRSDAEARVQSATSACMKVSPVRTMPLPRTPTSGETKVERLIEEEERRIRRTRRSFTLALQQLRMLVGSPSLRMISASTDVPKSTLAEYFAGTRFPTRSSGMVLINQLVQLSPIDPNVRTAADRAVSLLLAAR